jgi:gas vesicle protein
MKKPYPRNGTSPAGICAADVTKGGGPMRKLLSALLGATVGAAAAFLFDPDRGRARRARLSAQSAGVLRRGLRGAGRQGRLLAAQASGSIAALRSSAQPGEPANDATLKDRVESALLRDQSIPKGSININAEQGIVVLRGEVQSEDLRTGLESRAAEVRGVWYVENLLHLPGEPAVTHR